MSTPEGNALQGVLQSSTRYADAMTALTRTIVDLEKQLNSMPGKRSVSVVPAKGFNPDPAGLRFDRDKDGNWAIFYEPSAMTTLVAAAVTKTLPPVVLLRQASVDIKLKAAPLLPLLLEKLASELNEHAASAERAVASVLANLQVLPKGGA